MDEKNYKKDYCELLEEILCSEANISKCFDLILSRTITECFDSIQDSHVKIKLLNEILSCYNERTNLLGKLLYHYSDLTIILNQFIDGRIELNDNLYTDIGENKYEQEFNDDHEYEQIDKYNSDLNL
ncbi:hypothetical protein LZ906_017660 (plasmid) [Paraclostridium ghonii]|uniref:hypothetical protein n=1 Tax=Paraclostridium ghonii TaxID=29358 RepID=UPI00202CC43A|nr:hypothetical protein [Paeniclostridium ghonii]MCM0165679.1 hypothetical protein [Paeniclostridium ghonii]